MLKKYSKQIRKKLSNIVSPEDMHIIEYFYLVM